MQTSITNRKISLIFSCAVMAVAGSLSAFSIISDGFRERFNISFSEVNIISAVGNASLYFSYFIAGPIYDHFGTTKTMIVCSFSFTFGYALLYASYAGYLPTNVTLLALYYFFASFGAVCAYTGVIVKYF
jgi:MFS family permease